jgi:hypothetical protein
MHLQPPPLANTHSQGSTDHSHQHQVLPGIGKRLNADGARCLMDINRRHDNGALLRKATANRRGTCRHRGRLRHLSPAFAKRFVPLLPICGLFEMALTKRNHCAVRLVGFAEECWRQSGRFALRTVLPALRAQHYLERSRNG